MSALVIEDVSLRLGDKNILSSLSIDFWDGHIHAVVGPNGAGKSTLAHTIMGLSGYTHHSGKILFQGKEIHGLPVHERARLGITLAWQEPARFEGITVREFLEAAHSHASGSWAPPADEALKLLGLDPKRYMGRFVDKTLSGGERKRVELASILCLAPRLVLMDEPDSGVDIEAVEYIFSVLQEFKKQGSTVVMVTHSPEVLRQADHAFLLCHGSLVDKGPADRMMDYFRGKCIPCSHPNLPDAREVRV